MNEYYAFLAYCISQNYLLKPLSHYRILKMSNEKLNSPEAPYACWLRPCIDP